MFILFKIMFGRMASGTSLVVVICAGKPIVVRSFDYQANGTHVIRQSNTQMEVVFQQVIAKIGNIECVVCMPNFVRVLGQTPVMCFCSLLGYIWADPLGLQPQREVPPVETLT